MRRVVAAEFEDGAREAGRELRDRPGGPSRWSRWPTAPPRGGRRPAARRCRAGPAARPSRPSGASAPKRSMARCGDRMHRERGQRRLLGRLPHHRVAAHQRQRRVPRPHRDREVEGRDHAAHAQRMPGFHHPVLGALGGQREAVELAREADREVADVDHFLHLAPRLGRHLAGLERDQPAEVALGRAQFLAEQPHQFAAPRRRHRAPGLEGRMRARDGLGGRGRRGLRDLRDHLARERRAQPSARRRRGTRAARPGAGAVVRLRRPGRRRCGLLDMGALRGGGGKKEEGRRPGSGEPRQYLRSGRGWLVKIWKDLMRSGKKWRGRTPRRPRSTDRPHALHAPTVRSARGRTPPPTTHDMPGNTP